MRSDATSTKFAFGAAWRSRSLQSRVPGLNPPLFRRSASRSDPIGGVGLVSTCDEAVRACERLCPAVPRRAGSRLVRQWTRLFSPVTDPGSHACNGPGAS